MCERYASIVSEMQKLLFRSRCQALKGRPNIFFCDLFVRFPDEEEWLLSQDRGSSLNSSCGEDTPSFSRRGFQFEWRIAGHLEATIGQKSKSDRWLRAQTTYDDFGTSLSLYSTLMVSLAQVLLRGQYHVTLTVKLNIVRFCALITRSGQRQGPCRIEYAAHVKDGSKAPPGKQFAVPFQTKQRDRLLGFVRQVPVCQRSECWIRHMESSQRSYNVPIVQYKRHQKVYRDT